MAKMSATSKRIIALAYFHRYGLIAVLLLCSAIWGKLIFHFLCAECLIFSAWSYIGYKRKWKHIYCSFQDAYHQKMTPNNIQWHKIKKSDAYGIPIIFLILGLLSLIVTWY